AAATDGKKLFTGAGDNIVRTWDMVKNAVEKQFTGHTQTVTALAASPNGQFLASASIDRTIRFWNQATGKEDYLYGYGGPHINSLAINAGGTQLLSLPGFGASFRVWAFPPVPSKALAHGDV